ncbi:MAG: hypothetical protein PVG27_09970 [Chloroflexota bacterium]|jgi:plastocyanin
MSRSRTLALVGTAALLLVSAAPIAAQDEASTDRTMDMEGLSIDVGGVEYAFTGLPTSVPAGTTLTFTNNGAEIHELVLARIADGVTESLEELLGMEAEGRDPMAEGLVTMIGDGQPLIAVPGQTADGSFTLAEEGRYVALCFVPTGLDFTTLEELGVDPGTLGPETDPSTLPPDAAAFLEEVMGNPPHLAMGMVQEFVVTAEGSEVGPLPAEEPTA